MKTWASESLKRYNIREHSILYQNLEGVIDLLIDAQNRAMNDGHHFSHTNSIEDLMAEV